MSKIEEIKSNYCYIIRNYLKNDSQHKRIYNLIDKKCKKPDKVKGCKQLFEKKSPEKNTTQ